MSVMDLEMEIKRFKMDLLRKMPFYGDIVMRLPFVENKHIPTARTNGATRTASRKTRRNKARGIRRSGEKRKTVVYSPQRRQRTAQSGRGRAKKGFRSG